MNIYALKDENAAVREQLRQLQAELRAHRAASESEIQEAQNRHRDELDEIHDAQQGELKALRDNEEAFNVSMDSSKALRKQLERGTKRKSRRSRTGITGMRDGCGTC